MSDKDDWTGALAALEALGRAAQERKLHRVSSLSTPPLNARTSPTTGLSPATPSHPQSRSVASETTPNRASQAKNTVGSPYPFKSATEPHFAWVADDADITFSIRTIKGSESPLNASYKSVSSSTFATSAIASKSPPTLNKAGTSSKPTIEAVVHESKKSQILESRQREEEIEAGLAFITSGAADTLTHEIDSYYIPNYVLQDSGAPPTPSNAVVARVETSTENSSRFGTPYSEFGKFAEISLYAHSSRQMSSFSPSSKEAPAKEVTSNATKRLLDLVDPHAAKNAVESGRPSASSRRSLEPQPSSSGDSHDLTAVELASSGSSEHTEANGVSTPDTSHSSIYTPLTITNASKMVVVDVHNGDDLLEGSRVKRNHLAVEAENIASAESSTAIGASSTETPNKKVSGARDDENSTSITHHFLDASTPAPPQEPATSMQIAPTEAHTGPDAHVESSGAEGEAVRLTFPVERYNATSRPDSPSHTPEASSLRSSSSSLRITKTGKGLILRVSSQRVSPPLPEETPTSDSVRGSDLPDMDAIAPGVVLVPDAENEDGDQQETSLEPFTAAASDSHHYELEHSGYQMPDIVDDISLSAIEGDGASVQFELSPPQSPMHMLPTLTEQDTPSTSAHSTPEHSVHSDAVEEAHSVSPIEPDNLDPSEVVAEAPSAPATEDSPAPIDRTVVMDYSQYEAEAADGEANTSLLIEPTVDAEPTLAQVSEPSIEQPAAESAEAVTGDAEDAKSDAESLESSVELSIFSDLDDEDPKPSETSVPESEVPAEVIEVEKEEVNVIAHSEAPIESEEDEDVTVDEAPAVLDAIKEPSTEPKESLSDSSDSIEEIKSSAAKHTSIPTTPIVTMDVDTTVADLPPTETVDEDPAEAAAQLPGFHDELKSTRENSRWQSDDTHEASPIVEEPAVEAESVAAPSENAMDVDVEAPIIESTEPAAVEARDSELDVTPEEIPLKAPSPSSSSSSGTSTPTATVAPDTSHTVSTPPAAAIEASDESNKKVDVSPEPLVVPINPPATSFRTSLLTTCDPYYQPAYRAAAVTYGVVVTLLEQHITALNEQQFKKTIRLASDSVYLNLFAYLKTAPPGLLNLEDTQFFNLLTVSLARSVASSAKPEARKSLQTRALFVLYYCRHGLLELKKDHDRWKASIDEKPRISRQLAIPVGNSFTTPFSWRCFCTFGMIQALKALQIGADRAATMTEKKFARPDNCVVTDDMDDAELVALALMLYSPAAAPAEMKKPNIELLSSPAPSTAAPLPAINESVSSSSLPSTPQAKASGKKVEAKTVAAKKVEAKSVSSSSSESESFENPNSSDSESNEADKKIAAKSSARFEVVWPKSKVLPPRAARFTPPPPQARKKVQPPSSESESDSDDMEVDERPKLKVLPPRAARKVPTPLRRRNKKSKLYNKQKAAKAYSSDSESDSESSSSDSESSEASSSSSSSKASKSTSKSSKSSKANPSSDESFELEAPHSSDESDGEMQVDEEADNEEVLAEEAHEEEAHEEEAHEEEVQGDREGSGSDSESAAADLSSSEEVPYRKVLPRRTGKAPPSLLPSPPRKISTRPPREKKPPKPVVITPHPPRAKRVISDEVWKKSSDFAKAALEDLIRQRQAKAEARRIAAEEAAAAEAAKAETEASDANDVAMDRDTLKNAIEDVD